MNKVGNNNETGLIKRKKKDLGFVMIANSVADDTNLSLRAKGLFLVIERQLDKVNWIVYKSWLIRNFKEGERAFNSAWKELKDNGYLIQYKLKGEKGKFVYEYELVDVPEIEEEKPSSPDTQKSANPVIEPTRPDIHFAGVDNAGVQNVGGIHNTELPNTILPKTEIYNTNTTKENRTDSIYNNIVKASCSDLSIAPSEVEVIKPVVPVEYSDETDKWFKSRFSKDKRFYGLDFSNGQLYIIFSDAFVKTQLQDNVEVLSATQYSYFAETLHRILLANKKNTQV